MQSKELNLYDVFKTIKKNYKISLVLFIVLFFLILVFKLWAEKYESKGSSMRGIISMAGHTSFDSKSQLISWAAEHFGTYENTYMLSEHIISSLEETPNCNGIIEILDKDFQTVPIKFGEDTLTNHLAFWLSENLLPTLSRPYSKTQRIGGGVALSVLFSSLGELSVSVRAGSKSQAQCVIYGLVGGLRKSFVEHNESRKKVISNHMNEALKLSTLQLEVHRDKPQFQRSYYRYYFQKLSEANFFPTISTNVKIFTNSPQGLLKKTAQRYGVFSVLLIALVLSILLPLSFSLGWSLLKA